MAAVNALAFGGGGLVGTAKSLGHLVGLDQLIRDPASKNELKKSFFDYMAEAGVSLEQLEARFSEVEDVMPPEVRSGQCDHLPRHFKLCAGISGGSFLAAAICSEMSTVSQFRFRSKPGLLSSGSTSALVSWNVG